MIRRNFAIKPALALVDVVVVVFVVVSAPALAADFGPDKRSINGTGETLPAGETELGVLDVAYGVSDDFMVRAPSVALLVGYGRLEARERFSPAGVSRLSSYVFIEPPSHLGLGADAGWDIGAAREHSLTVGARVRHGPLFRSDFASASVVTPRTTLVPNAEYDYYGFGGDAYVGVADYLPYAGYTWAFTTLHAGVVLFPGAGLLPLPYVYWRF